jgi:hypothetical protein
MSCVIVKADFPGTTAEQREKIYEALERANWDKVHSAGNGKDPVWYASFPTTISETILIKTAINDFVTCSKPYCNPNIELQWGPSQTIFQGLV